MKTHTMPLLAALAAATFAAGSANAATITAADIRTAAAGTTSGTDLGTTSVTIGDLTISSTGASPDDRNLGGGQTSIGVVGGLGSKNAYIAQGEEVTLSFTSAVTVQSITITGHGKNDKTAVIGGFVSDPGASVSGLPSGWTVTYDAGTDTVSIASNNQTGYLGSYDVTFATDVDVTSLTISNPNITKADAGGLGFYGITYVPEPSSLALVGLGGLCMLKRRRRS